MTMVGGFDVHRKQITFDYVDDDGLVRWGEIRPATRTTLRRWLGEHCPAGDAEFALEGCTGWRYVVEELATAGVVAHLGDPAETAGLRGPKKRAKTDRADARLLRTLLLEGRLPESWIPPAHVLEVRTLGRLYCTLMDERRAWQQRIHAQLFHQGCPPIRALLSEAGRDGARAAPSCRPAGRQYVDTALRRIDELTAEIDPVRTQLVELCAAPGRVPGAAGPPVRGGLVVRGDHLGRDRRCAPVLQLRSAGAVRRAGCHRVLLGRQTLAGAPVPAGLARSCAGRRLRRLSARRAAVPRITPTTTRLAPNATATTARTRPWRWSAKSCAAAITRCVNSAMPPWRCPIPEEEVAA